MNFNSIRNIDIAEKTVFIRCDFNVPIDEYQNITDDRRIRSTISTIKYCMDNECKIILASHLGRPKGRVVEKFSLAPIAKRLKSMLKIDIELVELKDAKTKISSMDKREVFLIENLRFFEEEMTNDEKFSKELAGLADIYINDAFGVSHRAHSSVCGIAKFFDKECKAAGFLLQKEIEFFHHLVKNPSRPFAAVVGGSKVSGKLQALTNLLPKVDKILIGGGMAFTFLKATGENIGKSLVEEELVEEAKNVMQEAKKLGVKLYLPVDVVAAQEFSPDSAIKYVTSKEIPSEWMGLDIGPATVRMFREALHDCQTILWNGPMGVFEMDKFSKGSIKMSHTLAEAHATTVVGGGDSADVIQRAGDSEEMTFISTGGGASLELLEGKILPGIKALED
jgi:phosphoglycerate kinase